VALIDNRRRRRYLIARLRQSLQAAQRSPQRLNGSSRVMSAALPARRSHRRSGRYHDAPIK
jgi:hypothetical protein